MKRTTTTYTHDQTADIMHLSSIATAHKLRNLDSKEATPRIQELRRQYANDRQAINIQHIADRIADHSAEHDRLQALADELRKTANRITEDEQTRTEAYTELLATTEAMKHHTDSIKTLEPLMSLTLSDRQDLEQVATVAQLSIRAIHRAVKSFTHRHKLRKSLTVSLMGKTAPSRRDIEKAQEPKPPRANRTKTETLTEAFDIALYRCTLSAIARHIEAERKATTLDRTRTQPSQAPLTAEELQNYIDLYGGIGKQYAHTTKHGREYVEYKDYKKQPKGYYLITEYKTTAPHLSYETFCEEHGEDTDIAKNNGINIITNQGSREAIEELMDSANLTERERTWLLYFLDNTSAKHGQKAVDKHIAEAMKHGKKPRHTTADSERYKAMRKSAFDRIGITAERTQQHFFKTLCDKLNPHRKEAEKLTEDEKQSRQLHRAFRNYTTMGDIESIPRADLLTWTDSTDTTDHNPVIAWADRERAEALRTARAEAMHEAWTHSTIDNSTEEAQRRGAEAEAEYIRRETERAKARAKARRDTALILADIPEHLRTLSTTFAQWEAWTQTEREQHRKYLEILRG